MRWIHRLALVAMLAGATAFAQTSTGTGSTGSAGMTPGSSSSSTPTSPSERASAMQSATEAGQGAASMSASGVLSMLHQVDQDEIRLARIAQSKATSDKVKDYAKDMIDDHTALDKKVSDFVQNEGKGKVTLSATQIPAEKRHQLHSMVSEAESLLNSTPKGPRFDEAYMSSMVRSHEAVLANLDAALPSLKGNGNDKVHDLVSTARDKVKDHRDHAMSVVKDLNKSSSNAVGGSGSTGTGSTGTGSMGSGSTGSSSTGTSTGSTGSSGSAGSTGR